MLNFLFNYKPEKKLLLDFVDNKKYKCVRKINSGGFGKVFLAINTQTKEQVAIKIENGTGRHQMLQHEFDLYKKLDGGIGIPKVQYFGKEETYNALVMDLLGPSLEQLFNFCERKFSLKTILMIGDQLMDRIEYVHSKNYIHRDIKSENILIGRDAKSPLIYLVDFGIGYQYRDPNTAKHIDSNVHARFCGTWNFASINSLRNRTQSRRDDLEAIGYLLIYFHRGELPWETLSGATNSQKFEKLAELKLSTQVEDLCSELPDDFMIYMLYCQGLQFESNPDYDFLRTLFRRTFKSKNYEMDAIFDWSPNKTHLSMCELTKRIYKRKTSKNKNNEEVDNINNVAKKRKYDEKKNSKGKSKRKKRRK